MKIKKSLAALTATVSIMALATGCSSSGSSGVVDTQADKGLAVMGDTITYDPNHLVNDGQPIELGYWSWGDESTDPVISMLREYEKIHPNVTFKISQVAWSDYWVKTPLSLKGNKNAPVLFNVHNSEDALLRPHAVRLDGASDWRIFHQVVLPMSRKMFSGQYGTDYGGLFAATSVTIIPVVIVYLVFQKQFIAGIATGSGK